MSSFIDAKISKNKARGKNRVGINQEVVEPQVMTKKQYKPRRFYEKAYKLRMITAYDACSTSSERGELLRREGLYHARIADWKREQTTDNKKQRGMKKGKRIDHLIEENEKLKNKLAQAEAIIDLQKKVSELLGQHILPQESNGKR